MAGTAGPAAGDGISDFEDGMKECPTCDGSGKIMSGNRTCPDCGGKGAVPIDSGQSNAAPAGAELRKRRRMMMPGIQPQPLPRGVTMTPMPRQ